MQIIQAYLNYLLRGASSYLLIGNDNDLTVKFNCIQINKTMLLLLYYAIMATATL